MAAIAYPLAVRGYGDSRPRVRAGHLRLVGPDDRPDVVEERARVARARVVAERRNAVRRRRAALVGTVAFLLATWIGASALARGGAPLAAPRGATAVHGGFRYVVRPGDTVWSIASAMEPNGDPRPLVDEIEAELPGGVLRAGEVLHLP